MSLNLTIGSLFSGIGGLELGLEWAGVGHTVWQVEQDEYCRAVLAKHWPAAQRFDDVRTVGAHNLAPVDVICGGFPCQDISYAGKGAGLAGERSGLWYEYARIIGEMGPRYVVVENVAALLTRGIGDILGTLADLGYDAEWSRIAASDVGALHRRERLFLVAYPAPAASPWAVDANVAGIGESRTRQPALADSDDQGLEGHDDGQGTALATGAVTADAWAEVVGDGAGWWATEPDVGRVAHGVPARVDRLRALGNAVVPQVAEVVGQVIVRLEAERLNTERVA